MNRFLSFFLVVRQRLHTIVTHSSIATEETDVLAFIFTHFNVSESTIFIYRFVNKPNTLTHDDDKANNNKIVIWTRETSSSKTTKRTTRFPVTLLLRRFLLPPPRSK